MDQNSETKIHFMPLDINSKVGIFPPKYLHCIATNGANITSQKVFFAIENNQRKYARMTLVLSVLPYTESTEVGDHFALYCLNMVFLLFASGQQKAIIIK